MKKTAKVLGLLFVALFLAVVSPVFADQFSFTYTPTTGIDTGGSGILTATNLGSGEYQVTGITGTWDGFAINGLLSTGTCCSNPANDNLLYLNGGPYLDLGGLGLTFIAGLVDVNLYYSGTYIVLSADNSTPGNYIQTSTGDFTVAPEPGSLVMLGAGLLVLGALLAHKHLS